MNLRAPELTDPVTLVVDAPIDLVAVDLYRDVHKGIRHGLFSLCERVGRLDPADDDGIAVLAEAMRSLFELLEAHAAHEDGIIGPALRALDETLDDVVRREHAALDAAMHTIRALQRAAVHEGDGRPHAVRRWYLALASFTAAYLDHEATEELRVSPVLHADLGAETVAEMEAAIVASITPDHFAGYLRLILPAANPAERAALVGGIRHGAPPDVFAATMGIAGDVLLPHDHRRLLAALG